MSNFRNFNHTAITEILWKSNNWQNLNLANLLLAKVQNLNLNEHFMPVGCIQLLQILYHQYSQAYDAVYTCR